MTDQPQQHGNHEQPEPGEPSLPVVELELDPASRSLSEALLLSFRLLKGIMILLIAGYLFSGTYSVDANEEAVVMRLGKLDEEPEQPGLHWSPPFPIAERHLVRVKEKKVLALDSFWFRVADEDKAKLVSELQARAGGLEPGVDGSLMTGDRNLVHLKLQVHYYIDDSVAYVRGLMAGRQALESAIAGAVDSATIAAVAAVDVDEILRGQVEQIMLQVKQRAQKTLDALGCGIRLDSVIAVLKTWPLQTSPAFIRVQQAENEKLQRIEEANGEARKTLNAAAGPGHRVIAERIRQYEQASQAGENARAEQLDAEIVDLLETVASGEAARVLSEAKSYKAGIVQEVQAAAKLFGDLLPQYRENPSLVRRNLWLEARREVFSNLSVEQIYLPDSTAEVRIVVGKSPELQRKIREQEAKKETEQ